MLRVLITINLSAKGRPFDTESRRIYFGDSFNLKINISTDINLKIELGMEHIL